jgi:hypothetical protein
LITPLIHIRAARAAACCFRHCRQLPPLVDIDSWLFISASYADTPAIDDTLLLSLALLRHYAAAFRCFSLFITPLPCRFRCADTLLLIHMLPLAADDYYAMAGHFAITLRS